MSPSSLLVVRPESPAELILLLWATPGGRAGSKGLHIDVVRPGDALEFLLDVLGDLDAEGAAPCR
jgi:hypothetical protein